MGTKSKLAAVFALGVLAGIGVQHRWPLGRIRDEFSTRPASAPRTTADLAALPRARRLVVVAVGQSNAANFGATRGAAGAGVYAFARGELFQATDPLPGGDGYGGSVWTRLGARLIAAGDREAVVFAVVAKGSTRVTDWAPSGPEHPRLISTLRDLAAAGLPPDAICWWQGETEGRDPAAAGHDYAAALAALVAACRAAAPEAVFLAAQSTTHADSPANQQIRLAQTAAPATRPGPDLDRLGAEFRADGTHLNARGLDAAAALWLEALRRELPRP
ncbi:MAG: hypothetical protein RLZZ15_4085 [Verrucomicrobiota bacterium]